MTHGRRRKSEVHHVLPSVMHVGNKATRSTVPVHMPSSRLSVGASLRRHIANSPIVDREPRLHHSQKLHGLDHGRGHTMGHVSVRSPWRGVRTLTMIVDQELEHRMN